MLFIMTNFIIVYASVVIMVNVAPRHSKYKYKCYCFHAICKLSVAIWLSWSVTVTLMVCGSFGTIQ